MRKDDVRDLSFGTSKPAPVHEDKARMDRKTREHYDRVCKQFNLADPKWDDDAHLRGGQGRTSRDVERTGRIVDWLAIAFVLTCAAILAVLVLS